VVDTVKGNVRIKSYDPKKEQSESVIIDLDMEMSHRDVEGMIEIQAVKDGYGSLSISPIFGSVRGCACVATSISKFSSFRLSFIGLS